MPGYEDKWTPDYMTMTATTPEPSVDIQIPEEVAKQIIEENTSNNVKTTSPDNSDIRKN